MFIDRIEIDADAFPCADAYPFRVPAIRNTREIRLGSYVTFLTGENGTGKSTLLKAIARRCGVYIWEGNDRAPYHFNPYADALQEYVRVQWVAEPVPGSYFSSDVFANFAHIVDDWASGDPGILEYYGGASLTEQSHGQCHMAYFTNRYRIRGIYFLDEPETALSPKRQIEFLQLLRKYSQKDHAQFLIASHSPILLAYPESEIFSLDGDAIRRVRYEDTDYCTVYRDFLANPSRYI